MIELRLKTKGTREGSFDVLEQAWQVLRQDQSTSSRNRRRNNLKVKTLKVKTFKVKTLMVDSQKDPHGNKQ